MKLTIQKWGNSAALRLPTGFLTQVGVRIGDTFDVDARNLQATLKVAKPRYSLDELLAQSDAHAEFAVEDREWLSSSAVGSELL